MVASRSHEIKYSEVCEMVAEEMLYKAQLIS